MLLSLVLLHSSSIRQSCKLTKSILVSTQQTRLLSAITRGTRAHDGRLGKDARSTVGVGTILGVNGRESNGILVILSQVEMSREPSLDATVFTDQFNVFTALSFVGMVEPAASINNVVFLQDTQSRSIGRRVRKDKELPAIFGRMVLDYLFKPSQLFRVDCNFVGSVPGRTENGRRQTNKQRLVGNLTLELRSRLSVHTKEHFQVAFISVKFINTFQVCVTDNEARNRGLEKTPRA